MLIEYTPIANLPQDVKSRLLNFLKGSMLETGSSPLLFEGYYISPAEVKSAQQIAKTQSSQILFG